MYGSRCSTILNNLWIMYHICCMTTYNIFLFVSQFNCLEIDHVQIFAFGNFLFFFAFTYKVTMKDIVKAVVMQARCLVYLVTYH